MQLDPSTFELVSVDGEMALLIRLGRTSTDPVPGLERVSRSFRVKEPDRESLAPFLAQATTPSAGARCRAGPLYKRYRAWCEEHGVERLSLVGFYRAMKARGFRQIISNGHWWRDLVMHDAKTEGTLL